MFEQLFLQFWPYLAVALGALATLFGVYRKGKRDEHAKNKEAEAKRDAATKGRMDKAKLPSGSADVTDWLRKRSEPK